MDIEEAQYYITVALTKSPWEEFSKLMKLDPSKKSIKQDKKAEIEGPQIEKREKVPKGILKIKDELASKKTIEEQLELLYEREKMLLQKMQNRVPAPSKDKTQRQTQTKTEKNEVKGVLDMLRSPGPLSKEFFNSCSIPFVVPLPTDRVKAIDSISTVTLVKPPLNKPVRKTLVLRKIIEYFDSRGPLEAEDQLKQSSNKDYHQLLSKLVFKHVSDESLVTFQSLRRSISYLENFKGTTLPPKVYSKLAQLYHEITRPEPEEFGRMLECAKMLSNRLEKKYERKIALITNVKKKKVKK